METTGQDTNVGSADDREDVLNEALDRLSRYRYLEDNGFACHAPMGAQALTALGYRDQVSSWVEAYKTAHRPLDAPPARSRLELTDESHWRPALGDFSRVSDWEAAFAGELADHPWQDVVTQWAPVLLPGYAAGLTHGLLRVAHCVRALPTDRLPSPIMLQELSRGLAFWASAFAVVSAQRHRRGSLSLQQAIERLPRPTPPWTPMEAGTFSRISELADFPDAVDALAPPESTEDALSDLTETFSELLVASPDMSRVPMVHTVTPVAAARLLLPYLPEVSLAELYGLCWTVSAAIVVGFTPARVPASEEIRNVDPLTTSELAARAVENGDVHAVKFTEAAIREHAIRSNPSYLLAAQSFIEHLPKS